MRVDVRVGQIAIVSLMPWLIIREGKIGQLQIANGGTQGAGLVSIVSGSVPAL